MSVVKLEVDDILSIRPIIRKSIRQIIEFEDTNTDHCFKELFYSIWNNVGDDKIKEWLEDEGFTMFKP